MTDGYINKTIEQTVAKGEEDTRSQTEKNADYIRSLMKGTATATGQYRVVWKERRYVDDYSEVPEGAKLQEGEQDGLYYETEEVEQFNQMMDNMREKTFEQYDWDEGQISEMESHIQKFEEIKNEAWDRIMSTGRNIDSPGGSYRIKGVGSALEKVHERDNDYESPDDLTDIFASTLYADEDTRESVTETTEAIKEEFGEENILQEKNYLPKDRNAPYYRAKHLIVDIGNGQPAEIQVKGKGMEEIGKVGHTAVFKDKLDLDEEEKDSVTDCLTQLVEATMGEGEQPDCNPRAEEIIQGVKQHGDEAEV